MAESDSSTIIFRSNAKSLLAILNVNEPAREIWGTQDLSAMVTHQLSAPIKPDLLTVPLNEVQASERERTLRSASELKIATFRDLLFHADPPVDLLRYAKDFFKARVADERKDSIEGKVAFLFYIAMITVARLHRRNISTLSDEQLHKYTGWVCRQGWVDDQIKGLIANR